MKRNLLVFLLLVTLLTSGAFGQAAVKLTPEEKKIAEGITAKQLSDYLYFVASDEMEGRDTPSRGLDTTAKFIGMNLSKWGFKPAGDNGSYYQKIELTRESVDADKTKLVIGGQAFKLNEDFFRLGGNGSVNAPLVFGKDGWMVKAKGLDAFQGVDVRGKIVVVYGANFSQRTMIGPPAGVTPDDLKGVKGVDWADPVTHATSAGAVGIIVIAPPPLQDRWEGIKGFFSRGNTFPTKLREAPAGQANPLLTILASKTVSDALFAGESAGRDSTSAFDLKKSSELAAVSKTDKLWTQNVVAIWEGNDPVLKNEMVAIGAHYDHIGISQNPNAPDRINNGADDDGSGTVSVLSIAEALAKAPKHPKRSVLFVWHCGEEKGLWGSEYFNKFPTVDIKNVIAQLNIDMIGRSKKSDDTDPKDKDLSGETAIYVIGKDMMSSTLGSIVDATNKSYLNLTYDTRYDDPKDTNRFFFRSDHFNYALNGIPITFWFDGVHVDYHQPGDEPQKIDYNKMEKVARTIMLTLLELTDIKDRPKIDKQLPPELTQR